MSRFDWFLLTLACIALTGFVTTLVCAISLTVRRLHRRHVERTWFRPLSGRARVESRYAGGFIEIRSYRHKDRNNLSHCDEKGFFVLRQFSQEPALKTCVGCRLPVEVINRRPALESDIKPLSTETVQRAAQVIARVSANPDPMHRCDNCDELTPESELEYEPESEEFLCQECMHRAPTRDA